MLKILRDNIKYLSWILWLVILVFIVFVFVDFGGGLGPGGGTGGAVAATIGDRSVSRREFEREYRQLEEQYREALGGQWTPALANQMQLPRQALERLVDRNLMLEEAKRQGIRVGDEEVARAILEIPQLRDEKGAFVGDEAYRLFLRRIGYDLREFEAAVRDDLTLRRLSTLLASSVAVADAEVERAWRERNESVELRWLLAPTARHQAAAAPTADQVRAYFDAHREEFRLADRRTVDYLLVEEAKLRARAEPTAEEVRAAYAERAEEFTRPEEVHARHVLVRVDDERDAAAARARIAEARAKLARGTSFEAVAEEYSDDPGSKSRGGDLGFFGRGQMVPAFEEAAFGAAPGELVGPVETSFGLHLIQVVEKREARTQPLAEVESQLRAEIAMERAGGLAESRARELAQRIAKEEPATAEAWQALADGEAVVFLSTEPFSRTDAVPGIGRGGEFANAAFALAEPGDASAPVAVPRGWAILRLRESLEAKLPELAEVEPRVRAAVQREQANEAARVELERVRAGLGAGRTLADAAASLGLEVRESGTVTRRGGVPGLPTSEPIVRAAFELAPGAIGGPVVVPQGAVLFEVVARQGFDPARFAAERDSLRDELRQEETERLTRSILAERREEVGVSFDPQLAEQLGVS
jgi:peptidyl-prolyl cis-trans isomerase D